MALSKVKILTIIENQVKDVILHHYSDMDEAIAISFAIKAELTQELDTSGCVTELDVEESFQNWFSYKFSPFIFKINEKEYLDCAIQALKVQFLLAGTDYGTSRQRDLGQKWSDTIRGYIGEFGVKKVFKERFNADIFLGHNAGSLDEFLPTDIHKISISGSVPRKPRLNVSIKTTKSNGIWLDIPGDQFNHSDIYILSKIGVGTDHLFSFFKHISVFKDKILKCGFDEGCISQEEATDIYNQIPTFKPIYGYVCGFVESAGKDNSFVYSGNKGRTNFKIIDYCGKYEKEFLEIIKEREGAKKVEFEGIGNFSQSNRYVFGMKSLRYSDFDWNNYVFSKI